MIISANQPYFAPYSGFFLKAFMSDKFVLLDSVQFPRGGNWITRNRFKNDKGVLWIKIPVWKKGLGLQCLDQVRICDEFYAPKKYLESIRTAYMKAPYFKENIVTYDLNLETLKTARANRPVIRDIRPQIYTDLYELSRHHTKK